MYMDVETVASRLFPDPSLRGYISGSIGVRTRTLGFPIYKVFTGRKLQLMESGASLDFYLTESVHSCCILM